MFINASHSWHTIRQIASQLMKSPCIDMVNRPSSTAFQRLGPGYVE